MIGGCLRLRAGGGTRHELDLALPVWLFFYFSRCVVCDNWVEEGRRHGVCVFEMLLLFRFFNRGYFRMLAGLGWLGWRESGKD